MTSEVSHPGQEHASHTRDGPSHTAGQPASTGDPNVDRAVAGLADLEALPVSEHPARYDEVHAALHDILTAGGQVQR